MTVKDLVRRGGSFLRSLERLTPVVAGTAFLALSAPASYAQDAGQVVGRVLSTIGNQADNAVPGVTIRLSRLETETDDEGRFKFGPVPAGRYEIRAEILGCQLESKTVEVMGFEAVEVDFSLSRPIIAIPGLVASGLATAALDFEPPYTVGRLDPAKLERHPGRSIADLIRGEFPSAKIVQGSGLAGADISIQLRGRRSISTPQVPLVVVDGVMTGGGTIDLNPRDVEDILVLKGSAASAHYGSRGQAGVIEITTKRGSTRARAHREPLVIVDGVLSSAGLNEIDPAEIESMELVGGAVARLLFGRGAPEAGLVRIRTRAGGSGDPSNSCYEPFGSSGQPTDIGW